MDDLALAHELTDACDAITLGRFRATDLRVETKPDDTPVSEADRGAEEAVRARLEVERPHDAVVGEEYGSSEPGPDGRRWIIDPIDGTKNYVRGIPVWGTLLALEEADELRVAVVSSPALGRRWWAVRGAGAHMYDRQREVTRPLRVSGVSELPEAEMSLVGLESWRKLGRLDTLLDLAHRCRRARGWGDFWAYMLVAEGSIEIALDPEVSLWDLAAPQLIVEEAGGRFTDLSGRVTPEGGDAVATNALVHDAVLEYVGRDGS